MRTAQWGIHVFDDGFVPQVLTSGSEGLPIWGGSRNGEAALVFTSHENRVGDVLDLGSGALLTAVCNGGNAVAVTSTNQVAWIDLYSGRPPHVDVASLPSRGDHASPSAAWATCGDREFRVVLAFPRDGGHELKILSDQDPDEYVATDNSLYAPHDLTELRVTAHQGVLLVAGPVSDTQGETRGCRVWLCDGPDFGDGGWSEQALDPEPAAVTDCQGGAVDWWWAGHDDQKVVVWHESRGVLVPPLPAATGNTSVVIVDAPHLDRSVVLGVQERSSGALYWQHEGIWVSLPLPEGQLREAIRTPMIRVLPEQSVVIPERLHLLIEDTAYWLDWRDATRYSRAIQVAE